jgi:hypothetical protein
MGEIDVAEFEESTFTQQAHVARSTQFGATSPAQLSASLIESLTVNP